MIEESRRSALRALVLRLCGIKPTTRISPLITLGVLLPLLRAPTIPSRGAIKGNWDMKTARHITTWLAARPETSLIQLVDVDAP